MNIFKYQKQNVSEHFKIVTRRGDYWMGFGLDFLIYCTCTLNS